jgi:hypothetical protein
MLWLIDLTDRLLDLPAYGVEFMGILLVGCMLVFAIETIHVWSTSDVMSLQLAHRVVLANYKRRFRARGLPTWPKLRLRLKQSGIVHAAICIACILWFGVFVLWVYRLFTLGIRWNN